MGDAQLLRRDYSSEYYPTGSQVDEDIQRHMVRYYTAVDTLGAHEEYALSFARDAVLTLPNGSSVRGHDDLRALHQNMWHDVESRYHRPLKVFHGGNPTPSDTTTGSSTEVVVIGSVEYWSKTGACTKKNMASYFQLQKAPDDAVGGGGGVRIRSLAVWLS
ncbi:uncharacterized protein PV07_04152 [Cladophialophora immunda]|uniref:Uncharacterized protein n=1 Tax=Cladophialophora immunda TaxID=569365 RepID=A0A0D1ZWU1_9EURO|nr:uncharacterized protein PV07_04152 [Cladophialophora immunda]KIW32621.1 hypothetical protein PV07_04152 [Cladophialophora immunda]